MKKHKAMVVKKGQHKLVLDAEQHQLPIEKISKFAIKVIKRLKQAGFEAYLVGGGVRDLLLGKTPKDFDVSTNATPEQVRRLFTNARIIGRRFKIVHIVYTNNDIIEVTTFRGGNANKMQVTRPFSGDGKAYDVQVTDQGMLVRDNSYGKRIEDDAQRRDFTINAIYLDIQTGELIDMHGGLYDLSQGVIDIIGDPETRYREDPVRILRAARFSAKLGFALSRRTLESIEPCAQLLYQVAPARMYDEVNKLFLTGHAQASFRVLSELHLFSRLFTLSEMLLNSSSCRDLLNYAFASTDQRFHEGKCNKPHFLYAIILWNEFLWDFYEVRDDLMFSANNINYKSLISFLASSVVINQYSITAMPEQIIRSIALLWRLQFLLESREPEKYVKETTSYNSFRAAFDLFKLRAQFDSSLQSRVEFWQPYYDACKSEAERRSREDRPYKDDRRGGRRNRRDRDRDRDRDRRDRGSSDNGQRDSEMIYESSESISKARNWRKSMNLEP
ncbi:polynucleotide adenylyltransferase PcnB [Anaerobiospirillum sp. NML02-A-032]|uniref:polynucleotide adenylyltransferase PcnB n=1 Tax=Anaerobiospirillum sp. NML02-A-032 TaxID=2932818 RepID=UPI001FF15047|nr:polynucleotide adenylyltransferase PcnB [Anaerobiospirillum sp. NML02-A-032]MCK0540234.1 polynucleotide adenylyltransferase PcnB [Anaerobiospirillum sp. NML02-A-032]